MAVDTAKKLKKGESGAQLLARLSTRPDLSSIDPLVFSQVSASESISTKLTSHPAAGKVVEIYGTEGVGKTELILSFMAKICLPPVWKGILLEGLGAKVLFIDTDYKFSVLRLAIVVEKQILACLEKSKQLSCEKGERCHKSGEEAETSCNPSTSSRNLTCQEGSSEEDGGGLPELCPQDIEELVQDSLGRVQVMRVSSSQQLLVSLLSLEQTASHDPLLSLVAIDSISAFHWLDKCQDSQVIPGPESNMSSIAQIISRLVSNLGLTFLVVKSALTGNKQTGQEGREERQMGHFTNKNSQKDKILTGYSEFLGKSWSSLSAMKIVMSKSCNGKDKEEINVACSDWQLVRKLTFVEDKLEFL